MGYNKNPCIEASFVCPTSIQALGSISKTTLGPSGHGMNTPSSRLGTLCRRHRQWFMTKNHVCRLVMLVRRQFKQWCLVYNTKLGPSDHGRKQPSSRLRILYSYYRQWFMTKIHVCSLILFVRRQFKHWGSVSSTTLGPSGHGKKPLSSRLGTLYSHYRQWFITKIHVLGLVLFIRHQIKCCGLVYNKPLDPSCHGMKTTSSRLGTLYSC